MLSSCGRGCILHSFRVRFHSTVATASYQAKNEPLLEYLPGSEERRKLKASLKRLSGQIAEVPIVIGDREIRTKDFKFQVVPFDHRVKIAKFYLATPDIVQNSIDESLAVRRHWESVPLSERCEIFLRAADLICGKYRADISAATMLGQGKTVYQAEIDAAAELADFLRFNVRFAQEVTSYQPISTSAAKNRMEYRGLEGFVAAISPFNFTAIGGNLSVAPAIMVIADVIGVSSVSLNHEAGLPPGVINFVPSDGPTFGSSIVRSPHLAAINFTGSVPTFQWLWRKVSENLGQYRNFPRLVGEVGGKNFHLVHKSANIIHAVNNTIRSAFEYSGQKCSACSRVYVAEEIWSEFKEKLLEARSQIKMSTPFEFDTFMSAVIDEKAFGRIKGFIEHAKNSRNCKILAGGKTDNSKGYFIEPTIVQVTDPKDMIMREEIFGPVLSVYVYKRNEADKITNLVNDTTAFALTGSIFAEDSDVLKDWERKLRFAAGNFYINDKSTGAVVGQQPFGGARHSGTNDKAGAPHYMLRWVSAQTVKEGLQELKDWKYPHMSEP